MQVVNINIGDIFDTNNYGKLKIISDSKQRRGREKCYDIEFIDTGSIRRGIARKDIIRGEVKDYYRPSIAGVGYLGEGILQKDYKYEYSVWKHMLHRCYNPNCDVYYKYGALGVTVCERWLCFKNFVEDISKIDGYDKRSFKQREIELDKDLKCNDFPKQYNIKNCTFVSRSDNVAIFKLQKNYKVRKFRIGQICKK